MARQSELEHSVSRLRNELYVYDENDQLVFLLQGDETGLDFRTMAEEDIMELVEEEMNNYLF